MFAMERHTVVPPREPVTVRHQVPIGLDATRRVDARDFRIIESNDSAVVLRGSAHGSTVRRFEIVRAGRGNGVPWPTHAVYAKVRDPLIEDVSASVSGHASDCFTLRMTGATLRRFECKGAPPHVVTYFQENDLGSDYTRGTVLLEHGRGTFGGDTAVWLDVNEADTVEQAFVFRDVHFSGPPNAYFLKVRLAAFAGSVAIERCTLNGEPVTTAMVSVPAGTKLTIS